MLRVRTMTLPDRFIDQASPAEMYEDAGLTAVDIMGEVSRALKRDTKLVGFPGRA